MEIGFTIATVLLVLFALLGMFDGFYLHLVKYKLFDHPESKFEHLTHTIRGIFFPPILYFLYLNQSLLSFYIGMAFVILDIVALGVDAFVEKDSRNFMGGLPRWEYIIHLFVNGFHFASIAVYLMIKLDLEQGNVYIRQSFEGISSFPPFIWLVQNLIPGAIIMALLHILAANKKAIQFWRSLRKGKSKHKKTEYQKDF